MTPIRCVLCLVVLAICAVNTVNGIRPLSAAARALKADSNQAEFDYFMFVRQWPGGYCSQHSCPRLHTHGYQFTIHGLWPNYDNGKWPQFCDADLPFRESDIDDLAYVMDEEWPSFSSANSVFWSHEWNKHGTCALHVLSSEHKYFKTTLKLHYKLDLSAAFRAAGIEPSSSHTYSKDAILDAVDDLYGAEPQLHCSSDGTLMEVWMCLDKDLRPFTCRSASQASPANDYCERVRIPPPPGLDQNHGGWLSPKSPDADEAEPQEGLAPATSAGDAKRTSDASTQTGLPDQVDAPKHHGDDDYDDYTHDDTGRPSAGGGGGGGSKHRGGDDDYDDYTHDDTGGGGGGGGSGKHHGGDDDYDDYTHDDTGGHYAYAGSGGSKHRGGDDDYDDYTHDDTGGGSGGGGGKHHGGYDDYDDYTHDYAYADDSVSIEAYDVEVKQGSVAWTALEGAEAARVEGGAAVDVAAAVAGQSAKEEEDDDDEEDSAHDDDDDDEEDKDEEHRHGGDDEEEDEEEDDKHHHHHHHRHDDDDDDDDDEDEKDGDHAAAGEQFGHHGHDDDHHDDHHEDHHDDDDDHHEDHHDDHHEGHHHHHRHHAHDDADKAGTHETAQLIDAGTQTDGASLPRAAAPPAMAVSWLMLCGCAAMVSALVVASAMLVWRAASRSQALLLSLGGGGGVATGVPAAMAKDPEAQALLAEDVKGAKGLDA